MLPTADATLPSMDTVRFGRVLGLGARGAAKAVRMAVDAARSSPPPPERLSHPPKRPQSPSLQAATQLRQTKAGLARGGQQFREAAWKPFLRLSGVLWLELTGVFFGLFVLFGAVNAWKLRHSLYLTHANHAEHQHLLWSVAMTALFGYFCISSFVRASRRSR